MKWSLGETKESKNKRRSTWHKWFAWYPVVFDNQVFWLETLVRKGTQYWGEEDHSWWCYEYKEVNDV